MLCQLGFHKWARINAVVTRDGPVEAVTQCRRCERCGVYHRRDIAAARVWYNFAKSIGVPTSAIDRIILGDESR